MDVKDATGECELRLKGRDRIANERRLLDPQNSTDRKQDDEIIQVQTHDIITFMKNEGRLKTQR